MSNANLERFIGYYRTAKRQRDEAARLSVEVAKHRDSAEDHFQHWRMFLERRGWKDPDPSEVEVGPPA